MGVQKRFWVVGVVGLVALAAVAVAIAARGEILSATSTFDAGGTTKGGGGGASALAASIQSGNVTVTNPTFTVHWSGRAMQTTDVVFAEVDGWIRWYCENLGGNNPGDSNTQKSPTQALDLIGSDTRFPVRNGKASGDLEIIIEPTNTGLSCQGNQAEVMLALWGGLSPTPAPIPPPPTITLKVYDASAVPIDPTDVPLDTEIVPPPVNPPFLPFCRLGDTIPAWAECLS